MAKMAKYGPIQVQISGQWLELGGSYLWVKVSSPKGLIGGSVARGFLI